ncbi:hypothetical protein ACIROD_15690 [Peribacillus sp. NPDC101481]
MQHETTSEHAEITSKTAKFTSKRREITSVARNPSKRAIVCQAASKQASYVLG